MGTVYARESKRSDLVVGSYTVTEFYRSPNDAKPFAENTYRSRPKPSQRVLVVMLNCALYRLEWIQDKPTGDQHARQ